MLSHNRLYRIDIPQSSLQMCYPTIISLNMLTVINSTDILSRRSTPPYSTNTLSLTSSSHFTTALTSMIMAENANITDFTAMVLLVSYNKIKEHQFSTGKAQDVKMEIYWGI
ncbi:hypothetical protein RRG08_016074 [Elysia crispata]|uniref:Uncharacterized protein n=1 Tax=Elysia crispata TaxID=231223 RepID=A0AAE0ZPL3_9GAST|nr:hypothetical protein RRG08_016074 [Elysia crispata]